MGNFQRQKNKVKFALWSLKARFRRENNRCPYCQSSFHLVVQRKHVLIQVRKCLYCDLFFRWPTDTRAQANDFYEDSYAEGVVTDLPTKAEVESLKKSAFKGSIYEQPWYLFWLEQVIKPPARILDFGASWGYTIAQFRQAGYKADGFELSSNRAKFGRENLGVDIFDSWEKIPKSDTDGYDAVFTAHVLEHLSDVHQTLENLRAVTKIGGRLIIIVPNGGGQEARRGELVNYVGQTHTVAFTGDWFRKNLSSHGWKVLRVCSSFPKGEVSATLDGDGLICIAERDA